MINLLQIETAEKKFILRSQFATSNRGGRQNKKVRRSVAQIELGHLLKHNYESSWLRIRKSDL